MGHRGAEAQKGCFTLARELLLEAEVTAVDLYMHGCLCVLRASAAEDILSGTSGSGLCADLDAGAYGHTVTPVAGREHAAQCHEQCA